MKYAASVSDPERVAIVCGGGIVSGKEIMVLELAKGLRSFGYDIEVVSSRWSDGNFARRLQSLGLPTYKVWFGFISATLNPACIYMTCAQIARWPQLLAGYWSFLRRFKPNKVIHTNWHSLLTILPFIRAERDIYWVHEVMPNKPQYRKVFGWFAARLQCFVAVSHAVAKSLQDIGIAREKIRVLYNGLPDPLSGSNLVAKREAGIRIGIVGQVGPWKGHDDLVDAFRTVLLQHSNAKLLIFGAGAADYEAELRQRVLEIGLEHNVVWRGFVNDPSEIYGAIDMLVVPSRSADPLPTSAIEAGLFGLPVIASRCGGLPEIIEDGVTGYLFQSGAIDQLAQNIVKLIAKEDLRVQMGQKARARALSLFGRDRFVRDFSELLRQRV